MNTKAREMSWLPKLAESSATVCESLNRSQKFYFFGAMTAVFSAIWWMTPAKDVFISGVVFCGVLLTLGVISDVLALYKVVWDTTLGKAILLLSYFFSTNIAYALASRIVNEVVGFETSGLSYAVNFVAVLLVPLFIFASTAIIFIFCLIFGQFYLMIAMHAKQLQKIKCLAAVIPTTKEAYPGITFVVRIVVFPAVVGFLWGMEKKMVPSYDKFIEASTSSFIFNLEANRYSRCKTPEGSKVIKVNDTEIIVVEKSGDKFVFKPQPCIPLLTVK